MDQLKNMKETLMGAVQSEVGNWRNANAEELGAAIDMIKDLSEAIYYCTITEAMEKEEKNGGQQKQQQQRTMYYTEYPMRYYDGSSMGSNSSNSNSGNSSGGNSSSNNGGSRNYSEPTYIHDRMGNGPHMRDHREGKSPESRKMYMESKRHGNKDRYMEDLERYMFELCSDLTEMMHEASPEEKQMLKTKLNGLTSKL